MMTEGKVDLLAKKGAWEIPSYDLSDSHKEGDKPEDWYSAPDEKCGTDEDSLAKVREVLKWLGDHYWFETNVVEDGKVKFVAYPEPYGDSDPMFEIWFNAPAVRK